MTTPGSPSRESGGSSHAAGVVDLKSDARACLLASMRAVDPAPLVAQHLAGGDDLGSGPVCLVGIGKAAPGMARGARDVLGDRITRGVLLVPDGVSGTAPPSVELLRAGHPVPDERGVAGSNAVADLVRSLRSEDQLLCLVSGGGSALMTLPPPDLTLADVRETTGLLLRSGATIDELNAVRKHLDQLKGGRLARLAAPARVLGLVLSDVVGDPLDVIASGPLSPDATTFATAIEVLRRREVWSAIPPAVRDHLTRGARGEIDESPTEEDPCFARADVRIVGNNRLAAEAARREAERRGYRTCLLSTRLTGEAREVGRVLAALGLEARLSGQPLEPPCCLVAAGESTVTVRGTGTGGRNQEIALGAALALTGEPGVVVASIGTDGIDGPTDAAGALADGRTVERASARDLDVRDALVRNDAYPLLKALDDLIVTGPSGTNVMDVQVVLVRRRDGGGRQGSGVT